jgi:putative ABC transport system permease protein
VKQAGGTLDDYIVRGLTPGFIENGSVPLGNRARGYETDRAVWDALNSDPNVAVIDGFTIRNGFGPSEFHLQGVAEGDKVFDAPTITVRDKVSGKTRDVKIIGIIAFGSSQNFMGVFVSQQAFLDTFGTPLLSVHYAALTDPGSSGDVAKEIESSLLSAGVQAKSLKDIADERNALSRNFLYLMQAFMGLGLIVGIAAIGVIAFRTVVERRQQIGMLRAIGYKRGQVQLSFLLESGFVTLLGVVSGIGLSIWLSYFLVTGSDFPGDGDHYYVPWLQIGVIAGFTIVASLLMTLIPARQAARIPTAEALRYE